MDKYGPKLVLQSPAGAEAITYDWPLFRTSGKTGFDETTELVQNLKMAVEVFPELLDVFQVASLENGDEKCYSKMQNICQNFNQAVDSINKLGDTRAARTTHKADRPSTNLIQHLLEQSNSRVVRNPKLLNNYQPATSEVYGETLFEFVREIIDKLSLSSSDIFIDLGSGLGQVVLQVAATTQCKYSIGIEKAIIPSTYAMAIQRNFLKWMRWYGKSCGQFSLIEGDFLAENLKRHLREATVLFVNNLKFEPEVNHNLGVIFANLKDGVRIISSEPFRLSRFRISSRSLFDVGAVLKMTEIKPTTTSQVSWTSKPISYYMHTVDRTAYVKCVGNNGQQQKNYTCRPANQKRTEQKPASLVTPSALVQSNIMFDKQLRRVITRKNGITKLKCPIIACGKEYSTAGNMKKHFVGDHVVSKYFEIKTDSGEVTKQKIRACLLCKFARNLDVSIGYGKVSAGKHMKIHLRF